MRLQCFPEANHGEEPPQGHDEIYSSSCLTWAESRAHPRDTEWGRNTPWIGCHIHSHLFIPMDYSIQPAHQLTCFDIWEETHTGMNKPYLSRYQLLGYTTLYNFPTLKIFRNKKVKVFRNIIQYNLSQTAKTAMRVWVCESWRARHIYQAINKKQTTIQTHILICR